jgi:hypothetical protein
MRNSSYSRVAALLRLRRRCAGKKVDAVNGGVAPVLKKYLRELASDLRTGGSNTYNSKVSARTISSFAGMNS